MKKSFIFSLITICMLTFVVSCSSPKERIERVEKYLMDTLTDNYEII